MKSIIPFTPSRGRILIKIPDQTENTFKTTLDEQESNIGEVIAVGDTFTTTFGAKLDSPVKVGDIVQHSETTSMGTQGYQNISIDGKPYRVVLFDAIAGVINNE